MYKKYATPSFNAIDTTCPLHEVVQCFNIVSGQVHDNIV